VSFFFDFDRLLGRSSSIFRSDSGKFRPVFLRKKLMQERRQGARHAVSYPIRVRWKDVNGKEIVQEGLTENVGQQGALIYLPRELPLVGGKVQLTVTEDPNDEVSVTAEVIRLERNASHPQAALQLLDNLRVWKKKIWEVAGATVAALEPEELDDW